MEINGDFLTAKEAGKILELTNIRVAQLCNKGRFEGAKKICGVWFIPKESVDNFVKRPRGTPRKYMRRDELLAFIPENLHKFVKYES